MATLYIKHFRCRASEKLDQLGFVLMGLSMAGLVIGFETIGRKLVPIPITICLMASGALCFAMYLRHVKRIPHPIIDLSVLKYATYRASVAGGSLFRISIGALPFLLPLMLQYGFGMTPLMSGLLTFASAAGALVMKMTATPILRAFGFRPILIGGSLISVFFLMGCAFFSAETPRYAIFLFLLMGGFFRSLQFTALNSIAFAEIPERLMSRANTFYNMIQQLSLSLGVAVGAMLLNLTLFWHGETTLHTGDFWPSYIGIGLLSLFSALSFMPLSPQAGAEMSGHGKVLAKPHHGGGEV